jgi:hypothetical protein
MLTAQRSSATEANVTVQGNIIANTAIFGANASSTTNAVATFNATNSIKLPVGTELQKPSTGVTGMMRFNTNRNSVEVYDNSTWNSVSGLSEYGAIVVAAALTPFNYNTTTDIQSFTLPSAGTWEVTYIVRCASANGALVTAMIRTTSNVIVPNSELCVGLIDVNTIMSGFQPTATGQIYITTFGAQTFKLSILVSRGGFVGFAGQVCSDSSGRTKITFKKIYQV